MSQPTQSILPSDAVKLNKLARLLDTGVTPALLEEIQGACAAGVSPNKIAEEIIKGRK